MAFPPSSIEERMLGEARALGASLAGIARVDVVAKSPSHQGRIRAFAGGSIVVVALAHPEDDPTLDWGGVAKGTRGNAILMDVTTGLAAWLAAEVGMSTRDLPNHPEKGGVFVKDAAVMAGLGSIGKNNLFVAPEQGPRVRLRALAVDAALEPTGPRWLDPCDGCPAPCRKACPRRAFDAVVYSPVDLGTVTLPGRNGCFDRDACNLQMQADEAAAQGGLVQYCRQCELECIAGR